MTMRKYAAPLLALVIAALALVLPEMLSRMDDTAALGQIHIIQQAVEDDLSQWGHLSVAEKLMLLRTGGLQRVALPQEQVTALRFEIREHQPIPLEYQGTTPLTPEEERICGLWSERVADTYGELYSLQRMGGVHLPWEDGDQITLKNCRQSLYVEEETQLSFPVYSLELWGGACAVHLTVDAQSGRILAAAMGWVGERETSWLLPSAGAWRDYWRMDSLDPTGVEEGIRDVFDGSGAQTHSDKERIITYYATFSYNGQTVRVPLTRRDTGAQGTIVQWNYDKGELPDWTPAERLLGGLERSRNYTNTNKEAGKANA